MVDAGLELAPSGTWAGSRAARPRWSARGRWPRSPSKVLRDRGVGAGWDREPERRAGRGARRAPRRRRRTGCTPCDGRWPAPTWSWRAPAPPGVVVHADDVEAAAAGRSPVRRAARCSSWTWPCPGTWNPAVGELPGVVAGGRRRPGGAARGAAPACAAAVRGRRGHRRGGGRAVRSPAPGRPPGAADPGAPGARRDDPRRRAGEGARRSSPPDAGRARGGRGDDPRDRREAAARADRPDQGR